MGLCHSGGEVPCRRWPKICCSCCCSCAAATSNEPPEAIDKRSVVHWTPLAHDDNWTSSPPQAHRQYSDGVESRQPAEIVIGLTSLSSSSSSSSPLHQLDAPAAAATAAADDDDDDVFCGCEGESTLLSGAAVAVVSRPIVESHRRRLASISRWESVVQRVSRAVWYSKTQSNSLRLSVGQRHWSLRETYSGINQNVSPAH